MFSIKQVRAMHIHLAGPRAAGTCLSWVCPVRARAPAAGQPGTAPSSGTAYGYRCCPAPASSPAPAHTHTHTPSTRVTQTVFPDPYCIRSSGSVLWKVLRIRIVEGPPDPYCERSSGSVLWKVLRIRIVKGPQDLYCGWSSISRNKNGTLSVKTELEEQKWGSF